MIIRKLVAAVAILTITLSTQARPRPAFPPFPEPTLLLARFDHEWLTVPQMSANVQYVEGWSDTALYAYCHSDPVNFMDPTGLWERLGLMEELLKSAQGKEALKLTKGKLFGINPFTITATTYADSTLTQILTTKTFLAAGWTQLEPREVWLVANDQVSNADAAAYVIHEARHIWQLQNCPELTTYQREVDAFTYVEVYRKQHSMPASKATFRNPDGTLNAKGIIEHVRKTYGDGTASDAGQQKVIRQIPNLKGDNGKFKIR